MSCAYGGDKVRIMFIRCKSVTSREIGAHKETVGGEANGLSDRVQQGKGCRWGGGVMEMRQTT